MKNTETEHFFISFIISMINTLNEYNDWFCFFLSLNEYYVEKEVIAFYSLKTDSKKRKHDRQYKITKTMKNDAFSDR